MRERIKEHDKDIRFARTQTSAVSEHAIETGHFPIWRKVEFIDRYPHWYTRRVKEAIHIRLYPNNINRDSGIDIPEAWIITVKQHNSRFMRTYEGTPSNDRNNNEDWNALVTAYQRTTNSDTKTIDLIAWWRLAVLQSKRRDLHQKWLSWDKRTKFISYLIPRWIISTYFITLLQSWFEVWLKPLHKSNKVLFPSTEHHLTSRQSHASLKKKKGS